VQQVPIDVNHLPESAQELGDLTPRERELLALIREGLASREIAERLALKRGDRLPSDRRSARRAPVQAARQRVASTTGAGSRAGGAEHPGRGFDGGAPELGEP
jgi:FixJ family two-component response regulator